MSWFNDISEEANRGRERASVPEILTYFRNERGRLVKLAFLISGNEATAEECVMSACEMTLRGTVHPAIGSRNGPRRLPLQLRSPAASVTSAPVNGLTRIKGAPT